MTLPRQDALVAARQEIVRVIEAEEEEHRTRKKQLEDNLAVVEGALSQHIANTGGKSLFMDDGSRVSRRENMFVRVTNWDAFDAHILETGNLRFLMKNAKRSAVIDAINERLPDSYEVGDYFSGKHKPEDLPPFPVVPGVELDVEFIIAVTEGQK